MVDENVVIDNLQHTLSQKIYHTKLETNRKRIINGENKLVQLNSKQQKFLK